MNIVFTAFAYINKIDGSTDLAPGDLATVENYLKNAFISLKTTKEINLSDDVAIVVNFPLNDFYKKLFADNRILVLQTEFNDFRIPNNFKWFLSFFKLCALAYISQFSKYNKILLIDNDTITINSLKDLWEEADGSLLLYNINHKKNHKVRKEIFEDSYKIGYNYRNIVQYGGEFVCGSKEVIICFIDECKRVYEKIAMQGFSINSTSGDEMIISIAAKKMNCIIEAGAYINRYWTGKFYLVSTNYCFDPVSILHLPDEKAEGLISIFNYYIKNQQLPSNQTMYKILGLPKTVRPLYLIRLLNKLKKKANRLYANICTLYKKHKTARRLPA